MEERSNQRGKKERKGEEVKENGKSVKEQKRYFAAFSTCKELKLYGTKGLGMRLQVWE